MQPLPDLALIDAAHGKRTEVTLGISMPTIDLLTADRNTGHASLATAALHMAEGEPNKAVAVLLGCALDGSARGDSSNVVLAVGAAVHILRDVAASQLRGVVGL